MKIIRKSSRTSAVNSNGQVERAQIRYIVKRNDTDDLDDAPMLNAVREAAPDRLGGADERTRSGRLPRRNLRSR